MGRSNFLSQTHDSSASFARPNILSPAEIWTTNIVDHANLVAPEQVQFTHQNLLPPYSDDLAFELDLIDPDLPHEQF